MLKFNHQSGLEVILTPVLAPGVKLAPGMNRIGGELLSGLKRGFARHNVARTYSQANQLNKAYKHKPEQQTLLHAWCGARDTAGYNVAII